METVSASRATQCVNGLYIGTVCVCVFGGVGVYVCVCVCMRARACDCVNVFNKMGNVLHIGE